MKANRGQIERALDIAAPEIRIYLLYGPDESGSRALADRIVKSLGRDAERIDIAGATLKSDPARLADEAASISLFGGARHIRVEPAGDEIADAVDALLESPSAGNPVVVVAGALRKDAKLIKRLTDDRAAMVFASYVPEGRDADQLVANLARDAGLRVSREIAHRIAAATGGDRALIAQEIEKFALYLDSAPDRMRDLESDSLDALGADGEEGDIAHAVDAILGGAPAAAAEDLARIGSEQAITVVRAALRRLFVLLPLRSEVEQGNAIDAVIGRAGKSLFWKDKDAVVRQLGRWDAAALARAIERLAAVERGIKSAASVGPLLLDAEALLIARQAARR